MAKSRLTLQTQVLRRLGDTAQSIWTGAEIDVYLQEGYDLLTAATGILWDQRYLNDVANQALYDLPDDLWEMERVTWDDRRLAPATINELMAADGLYETTTGTVEAYALEGDGLRKLRKYRIPTANASSTAIAVTGTWGAPRDLTSMDPTVVGTWGIARAVPGW
ncbi:MAG: hypothetical protein EHM23_27665, partial [Acidobacteria bacterium]